MTGKIYMPIRSQERESCVGTSDNVVVPIDEFEKAIDGAIRIARNFDDGLSECGLKCPAGILALDNRLDKYYTATKLDKLDTTVFTSANAIVVNKPKGTPQNTRFPCG